MVLWFVVIFSLDCGNEITLVWKNKRQMFSSSTNFSTQKGNSAMRKIKQPLYACSFCNKKQEQVSRLIAGPNRVFVCDECIASFLQKRTGKQPRREQPHCSFCGKSQAQVSSLVTGPHDVYICDECIDLCQEIISEVP